MTVREIQGFLAEHYGTEVSPEFISSVTDEVMAAIQRLTGQVEAGVYNERPID